jgi:hypothetical protein
MPLIIGELGNIIPIVDRKLELYVPENRHFSIAV